MYIRDQLASLARPVKELKGFKRISLEPGEERTVEFKLGFDELSMLDTELQRVVEPGSSSKDIRLRNHLYVK
ncbi:MAG: fibronectin type III-like domain-contianing protein [Bacteroidales bacterium]|nr:fibronectin type III-like domain-contianing protein [Bacteroidales bacterium]